MNSQAGCWYPYKSASIYSHFEPIRALLVKQKCILHGWRTQLWLCSGVQSSWEYTRCFKLCVCVHSSICTPCTKTCKVLIASLGIAQHLTYSLCGVPLFPHTYNCCFSWQERNLWKLSSTWFCSFWETLPFSAICDWVTIFPLPSPHCSHETAAKTSCFVGKEYPKEASASFHEAFEVRTTGSGHCKRVILSDVITWINFLWVVPLPPTVYLGTGNLLPWAQPAPSTMSHFHSCLLDLPRK